MANNKKIDAITAMEDDFAKWYTDVCRKAELMDYSSIKGFIFYRPYGYALWERVKEEFDKKIKESGHDNVYMPMLIPQSLLQKEADHVEGFAPECAVVTRGGLDELEEPLIVRPTSETLFCEHYAKIVNSYRDLPKKYNQWCSVVRWEKTTRPFLRGAEFLWQEGHTIHATEQEARDEVKLIHGYYVDLAKNLLAIPMVTGRKTEKEKFAGAEETYTMEALMHDGKALQSATSHYFGQNFSIPFNIKFLDKDNKQKYVYQTSWGLSTRILGAVIMVHGDNNGLVLPPRVAPTQVIIVPIQQQKTGVLDKAYEIEASLKAAGLRVKVDASDKSPGWKFSDAEMRGIPVRIEIGPKDIEAGHVVVAKRNDGSKQTMDINESLATNIQQLLDVIHDEMYKKALNHLQTNTHTVSSYDEFKETLETKGGYLKAMWCGDMACEEKIKEETGATTRCIVDGPAHSENCVYCGKKAKKVVYFAKAY